MIQVPPKRPPLIPGRVVFVITAAIFAAIVVGWQAHGINTIPPTEVRATFVAAPTEINQQEIINGIVRQVAAMLPATTTPTMTPTLPATTPTQTPDPLSGLPICDDPGVKAHELCVPLIMKTNVPTAVPTPTMTPTPGICRKFNYSTTSDHMLPCRKPMELPLIGVLWPPDPTPDERNVISGGMR